MTSKKKQELGMDRDITRRDFLNGVNIAVAGSVLSAPLAQALAAEGTSPIVQMMPGYYPPTLTGMRGSHPGSFEMAHLLRDGASFNDATDIGEEYDLVVVGGGLSGLAAAHFYRKEAGPDARILIIENHDDFGGHAKRNEFEYKGRTLVDLGGAEYIEAPWSFPESAKTLLKDMNVDVSLAQKVFDHNLYPSLGMQCGVFFDKKTFGTDKLVAGNPAIPLSEQQVSYVTLPAELEKAVGDRDAISAFLEKTPLSEGARAELLALYCDAVDYLPGLSHEEKLAILRSVSYQDFLREYVKASKEVIDLFWMWRGSYMGTGMDLTPAIAAFRYGMPGAAGLDVEETTPRGWQEGAADHSYKEDLHFPDGNASLARLLVRHMIPEVASGNSMHDIISAKFDYNKLDSEGAPVRIRLNSTALHVRHLGDPETAKQVEITYGCDGILSRVRAKQCVMACYNAIIPHVCPEFPDIQKEALGKMIRMPLVSINVLVDNWRAFQKLGIFASYCPGSYFSDIRLTYPLQFDDYQSARTPDEPMTVHMYRIPISGEGTGAEQFTAGRYELLDTSFATFEENIREQLGAMLGEGGFDPARDIKAITVNRWPHGYAVGYDHENDSFAWFTDQKSEEKMHWLNGHKRFGRIAVANSDAGAQAMTEVAIEQGHRAIQELLNK